MENQFRLKLDDNKVLGPLTVKEIVSILNSQSLNKNVLIQKFPHGEWVRLDKQEEFLKIEHLSKEEETHLLNLKNINLNNPIDESLGDESVSPTIDETPIKDAQEFNYKISEGVEDTSPKTIEEDINIEQSKEVSELESKIEDDSDKTKVRTIIQKRSEIEEIDKTKLNPDYAKYLDDLKREEEEKKLREESVKEKKIDYQNEATQIIGGTELNKDLIRALRSEEEFEEEELEFYEEKKTIEKKKHAQLQKKLKEIELEEEEDEEEERRQKSKSFVIIGVIAILIIIFILPDDKEKNKNTLRPIKIVEPFIKFPARFDKPDKSKAENLLSQGLFSLRKYSYMEVNKAAKYFYSSMENQFEDNKAAAWLIFTFSYLLKNSNDYINDANTIFKLVQLFEAKTFTDVDFASAISYFYYAIGKYNAAIKTFDKYITLNSKSATPELFAVRLLSLIKVGDLEKAGITAGKLMTIPNKDLFIINVLYQYYKIQDDFDTMDSLIKESLRISPENLFATVAQGEKLIRAKELTGLKPLIYKINGKNANGSKFIYSKYLKFKGFFLISKGKSEKAAMDFQKSLSLHEDIGLLSTLANLENGGGKSVDDLINSSKAKEFLRIGKIELSKNQYKAAFKNALSATNVAPNLVEAKLFLAELQLRQGYIQDAINSLEEIYKDNGSSLEVLFKLIEAYTEAYKFEKVVTLLNAAQNITSDFSYKFYTAKARFALFQNEYNTASGWLQRAINANPIYDKNRFELAKLYIKYHDYQKGKFALKKAMDLDPANIDYRLEYAKILYEMENSAAAIGYLYNVLEDFPDNPRILSAIGIYYYRSGQVKRYKEVRDKLLSVPGKDPSLFEFLVESARLDDNLEKVIEYSLDLIEVAPGNLEARMNLANLFIENKKYKEAKQQIDAITERLESYPKLQYLNARLYYLVKDFDKAKMLVKKEIELNPTVVEAYILLADIFVKEKNLVDAKNQYLKALQIKPKNTDAILGVAYVAFHRDQYDMALDQYQKAIEIEPNRAEIHKLLGDAYRKLGQSQLAIQAYQQFLELEPDSKFKGSIETYIRTMK